MYDTLLWHERRRLASWRVHGTSARVGQPSGEPVSIETFKLHSRLTDPVLDESVIPLRLTAARRFVENYTGRSCLNQVWTYTINEAPRCEEAIILPRAPLVSVTSVKSYSITDVETVMSAATYFVDTASEPGRIYLHQGIVWPSDVRQYNGIIVTYTAGYGTDEEDVPEELRQAILLLAGDWYEFREASSDLGLKELQFGIRALLDPYRVMA